MTLLLLLLSLAEARITSNCITAMAELSAAIDAKDHSRCSSLITKCERSCKRPTDSPCFDLKLDCQDLKASPQPETSKEPAQDSPHTEKSSTEAAPIQAKPSGVGVDNTSQESVKDCATAEGQDVVSASGCATLTTDSIVSLSLIGLISLAHRRRS